MAERKFTKGLNKPGMAAQLRETVSQVVRETTVQNKPRLVEPVDYETFVLKSKTILQNDPQRELLLYPSDDVSQTSLPKRIRTVVSTVPQNAQSKASNLFVRQCLNTYSSQWSLVHYKYSAYSGSYLQLPKMPKSEELREQIYEVDAEMDLLEDDLSPANGVTKKGFLLKISEGANEKIFSNLTSKSYKRRYCFLRQEVDGAHILGIYKDQKKGEAKDTIVMDFCTEVIKNPKRGKFTFELRMSEGHKTCLLAAESDTDFSDWVEKLTRVIQLNKAAEEKKSNSLEKGTNLAPIPPGSYGTMRGLEQSMNPQLMKYARETDNSIAQARKENRHRIFTMYPNLSRSVTSNSNSVLDTGVEPYKERFDKRFIVKCNSMKFKLQAPFDSERGQLYQVEPYITTMALYDAKQGRKISEDFRFDLNHSYIRYMMPRSRRKTDADNKDHTSDAYITTKLQEVQEEWLIFPKQAIFNVTSPDPEIYLVIRIEKVLQSGIPQATEPYIKANADPKIGMKVQKSVKLCCERLGSYRMPFAWTARPVFKPYSLELDTSTDFPNIYRQESNRMGDEDLLKILSEYRKPDKMNRLTIIPGCIKLQIDVLDDLPPNSLTPSLVPLNPFPIPPTNEPTLEVQHFASGKAEEASPYTTYVNNLYVYPIGLKYDSQRTFTRARNIACVVEIRDSDAEDALPLKCIYGGPGEPIFISQASCCVSYHNTTPTWYTEFKISLPVQLHSKHHLLFSFYHVSCETSKKKETSVESAVGFSWVPLLNKGRLNVESQCIPVAMHLPAGYLDVEPLGLGRGYTGPDIRWVDGQKQLFSVGFKLVSTVATSDQHLSNFFNHAEKLIEKRTPESPNLNADTNKTLKGNNMQSESLVAETSREITTYLKALHAVDVSTLVSFLPSILNQLFHLLVTASSEDASLNVVRVLIHIVHSLHEAEQGDLLKAYIKYVFVTPVISGTDSAKSCAVHEELCKLLTVLLRPANMDFLVINKFLRHSGFFLQIMTKSMAQFLLRTGRIKMHRNERFQPDFCFRINNLFQVVCPYVIQKYKELPQETSEANLSLANFTVRCLSFMDRGLVFKLVNFYMDKFNPGDPRLLFEYKFTYLQILCCHEHYISLNLPLLHNLTKSRIMKEFEFDYCLSEDFCKHHFLVGLLLQEVRTALNEIPDVRWVAIRTLRDLLAKHEFDDRYQNRGQQARIASLYLPWIWVILENLNRLSVTQNEVTTRKISTSTSVSARRSNLGSSLSTLGSPKAQHRYTTSFDYGSPMRNSLPAAHRDPAYLAAIAGQASSRSSNNTSSLSQPSLTNGVSTCSLDSNSSTLSGDSSSMVSQQTVRGGNNKKNSWAGGDQVIVRNHRNSHDSNSLRDLPPDDVSSRGNSLTKGHSRQQSNHHLPPVMRFDKLQPGEVKDLLLTFLYVLKYVSDDILVGWWKQCSEADLLDFFKTLEICLHHFKYIGKRQIAGVIITDGVRPTGKKAMTLPARMQPPNFSDARSLSSFNDNYESNTVAVSNTDATALYRALLEANMATEIGLIALDCLGYYCTHFRENLLYNQGDNVHLRKVFDIYLSFLQVGQSENLFRHVFAALRSFISNFPPALFQGNATMCGRLCFELLHCCNSRLSTVKHEACSILYLLMRSNFEFTGQQCLTRVHLQVIISVSQLLGEVIELNNSRFQESLSLINSYATTDKAMQGSAFPSEVKDLTKRIRTVLMATSQMREHQTDPEMLLDLQHSLACSYAATPELKKTWLESMTRHHIKNEHFSEAAMCAVHTAALMAEFLHQRGQHETGCQAFKAISPNITKDESCLKLDSGVQDVPYSEETLLAQLELCAQYIDKAERYELLSDLYELIIPIYKSQRNYEALSQCYHVLSEAYNKIVKVQRSGKRLLGRYYRVAFYGREYFEEECGRQYIYKEPKVTPLSEVSERLYHQYVSKFGREVVKMIMDSVPVDENELDSHMAYIQVTHVVPYFIDEEISVFRTTEFEKNHNVNTFMYETPFTRDGKARGNLEEQWKRRTVVTTRSWFPYVKRRILIVDKSETELSPIEVALDEMQARVSELQEVVNCKPTDVKKLQLKLQGSISVQVNAGPLAYAAVFLDSNHSLNYPADKVQLLNEVFRHFLSICYTALLLNSQLISNDQLEYQQLMESNFRDLVRSLGQLTGDRSGILSEEDDCFLNGGSEDGSRSSFVLFSVISGTPGGSSNA